MMRREKVPIRQNIMCAIAPSEGVRGEGLYV